jgi:hypothetical protein
VPLWRWQVEEEAHWGHYLLVRRRLAAPTERSY